LKEVIEKLAEGVSLNARYFDHQLSGSLKDFRECHVKPDLLLVYSTDEEYLYLVDLGSHSDLFG
jgi:mRNA interferase YafQ